MERDGEQTGKRAKRVEESMTAQFTRERAKQAVRELVKRGVMEEVEPGKFRLKQGPTVEEAIAQRAASSEPNTVAP